MAIRWWLGLDTSARSMCPFCPDTALDPLGHHAVTCRHEGKVVIRHNRRKDEVFNLFRSAHQSAGAVALAAEALKLHSNGPKCQELGWSCIPLAVETYGNWWKEAHGTFSRLASYLAIHQPSPKSAVVAEI
eukprot:Em0002g1704a